jgi:hypothetical protein
MMKYARTAAVAALAVAALAGCGSAATTAAQHGTAASPVATSCAARVRLAEPYLTPAAVQTICAAVASNSGAAGAIEVLEADGYTVDESTVASSPALLNLGVASRATGVRGSDAEQVLVFTGHPSPSVPACKETTACTPAGAASELASQDPGTRVRADGLVVRITGTVAVFRKDGLPV